MALINEIIPRQGFEIVQDKIAEILLVELTNQKALQSLTSNFGVFIERQEPHDKSDDVMISVMLNGTNYDNQTPKGAEGLTTYIIDIVGGGIASMGKSPSVDARDKVFKYAGMIRYILSSAKYQNLDLPQGTIRGRYVEMIKSDTDFSNFGNHSNYDAGFIRFVRILFSVRIGESQDLWDSAPLFGSDTQISLNNTNLGYQLQFNN